MAYQLAREDPELVLEFIEKLKKSGEIEPDELEHIEQVARKWVTIAQENRAEGTTLSRGGSFTPFAFANSVTILSRRSGRTSPSASIHGWRALAKSSDDFTLSRSIPISWKSLTSLAVKRIALPDRIIAVSQ
jgi:hypothetical protein